MTINEIMTEESTSYRLYASDSLPLHWVGQKVHMIPDEQSPSGMTAIRTWFLVPGIPNGWANRTIYRGRILGLRCVAKVFAMGLGIPGELESDDTAGMILDEKNWETLPRGEEF